MKKQTVVFDFDGVVHSYKSGWKGNECIPDPPVDGIGSAITQIRAEGYEVVIVSTRCSTLEGRQAIRRWLDKYGIVVDDVLAEKPPAVCHIDDRAICFDGDAKSLPEKVVNFETWMVGAPKKQFHSGKRMRRCRGIVYVHGQQQEIEGYFHQWGIDYEELGDSVGQSTVAIIEDDSGKCWETAVTNVTFLD